MNFSGSTIERMKNVLDATSGSNVVFDVLTNQDLIGNDNIKIKKLLIYFKHVGLFARLSRILRNSVPLLPTVGQAGRTIHLTCAKWINS